MTKQNLKIKYIIEEISVVRLNRGLNTAAKRIGKLENR